MSGSPRDADLAWRLLAIAEELGDIGTWDLDLDTGRMAWSDGLVRLLDLEPDGPEPRPSALLSFIHPQDRGALSTLIRSLLEDPGAHPGDLVADDYRVVHADGSVAEVRARGRLVRDQEGEPARWVGSIQDVTRLRKSERALQARAEVTRALRVWESFDEGLIDLLRRIGRALEAPIASLWIWDDERGGLACRAAWHAPEVDATDHLLVERDAVIPSGQTALGRAWRDRRPELVPDITDEPRTRVRDAALEAGVRAVLAVPLLDVEDPLGIVTLAASEARYPDPDLTEALSAMGQEIGGFLARRRASLGPAPLTPRELEVLQLAADGLSGPAIAGRFVVSPSTVKTHFENIYEKLGVSDRAGAVALALRTGLLT